MIAQQFRAAAALLFKGLYRRVFQLNFGVVEPARVYRSGRPGVKLGQLVCEHQLASVLDLEKCRRRQAWCIAEIRTSGERSFDYFWMPISALRRPLREELVALITILESCRYPLLIHCETGSDRTGLVVALYLTVVRGSHPDDAVRSAFAPQFGHIPILGTEHLYEPFREYASWLRNSRMCHTRERFKMWVMHEYDSTARHQSGASDSNRARRVHRSR